MPFAQLKARGSIVLSAEGVLWLLNAYLTSVRFTTCKGVARDAAWVLVGCALVGDGGCWCWWVVVGGGAWVLWLCCSGWWVSRCVVWGVAGLRIVVVCMQGDDLFH